MGEKPKGNYRPEAPRLPTRVPAIPSAPGSRLPTQPLPPGLAGALSAAQRLNNARPPEVPTPAPKKKKNAPPGEIVGDTVGTFRSVDGRNFDVIEADE